MAPFVTQPSTSDVHDEVEPITPAAEPKSSDHQPTGKPQLDEYRMQIVWGNVVWYIVLHLMAFYTVYRIVTFNLHLYTLFSIVVWVCLCSLGVTAGCHRLWSHRSYKAKWPLRLVLAFLQTAAFQNHIYEWVRDHRLHHKFTDTNADPHSARRGFFFSHMGWLMVRKHGDIRVKGRTLDMSDLEDDSIVVFQRKWYGILMPVCCFLIPTLIPVCFWDESFWDSWNANILRYVCNLHITWLVNSAAHMWGMKPYDRTISSAQNTIVSFLALGEGWHNYHHTFPWDYKTEELGIYGLNVTTCIIDICAFLGLAYDLKAAPRSLIDRRILNTGDGSHKFSHEKSSEDRLLGSKEDVEKKTY